MSITSPCMNTQVHRCRTTHGVQGASRKRTDFRFPLPQRVLDEKVISSKTVLSCITNGVHFLLNFCKPITIWLTPSHRTDSFSSNTRQKMAVVREQNWKLRVYDSGFIHYTLSYHNVGLARHIIPAEDLRGKCSARSTDGVTRNFLFQS